MFQVMYGGRAIDDFDRRVLRTYMDEYMGDFIFDTFQPFHFYMNEEVDYNIPEDGVKDKYVGELSGFSFILFYENALNKNVLIIILAPHIC